MKKVSDFEYVKIKEKDKKKLTKRALKAIVLGVAIYFGIGYYNQMINPQPEINQEQPRPEDKARVLASIRIDGMILKIAAPEMKLVDNDFVYAAPEGFIKRSGICTRITCEGEPPRGYRKQEDGSLIEVEDEINYEAPEGYILVGSKAVEVVDPDIVLDDDGNEKRIIPEGYMPMGEVGIKVIELEPINELTLH